MARPRATGPFGNETVALGVATTSGRSLTLAIGQLMHMRTVGAVLLLFLWVVVSVARK
jgi:hypothetical protein